MLFTAKQERLLHARKIKHSHDQPTRPPVKKRKKRKSKR